MFDMSWGEVMVIGAVALIVIGPKDLPKALRTVGNMTAKMRRMASEFQGQFNEAMREAELDELRKQVQDVGNSVNSSLSTNFNPVQTARDELKGAIEGVSPPAQTAALPPDTGPLLEPPPEPAAPSIAPPEPAPPAVTPDGVKA